ncbi:MAG: SDR family oxidoreductase [Spartobacteria bacterium]
MNLELNGKIAMVAASSRGLGFGVARELAREGAIISLASRNLDAAEKAASQIRGETGARVIASSMDASDATTIAEWTSRTINNLGGIDLLVANAGGPPAGKFDQFTDESWQAAFELNLLSTIRMIRGVLPSMRQRGGGAILTITSTTVKEPSDQLILSNVMRSGVTSLVKTLSVQLAPEGIRVNNIMPGRIDTDRIRELDANRASQLGKTPEECGLEAVKGIPLGRYGNICEFGKAAAFLLSDAASYITGSSLSLDGGSLKTVW